MKFIFYPALVVLASAGLAPNALAQTLPTQLEGDRFSQPLPDLRSLPPERSLPVEQPVIPVPPPLIVVPPVPDTSIVFAVRQIDVVGSTILTADEIRQITQPLVGPQVTLQALKAATDDLTQLYLSRGYITSRATLDPQTITDGVVQIRVIEGGIERIEITGTQRLNVDYVRDRVQLGVSTPLNIARLEDQLRLLLSDPLIANVEPKLQAGTEPGQSILSMQITEADPFGGEVSFDNDSPPSIGSERAGINLHYRNLTGIGDEINSYYYRTTTGGSSILGLIYRVPLNPMEGTLQLSSEINRNRVTQAPFDQFDITGKAERYELSFRQPLIRSTQAELALSLGFTYQSGQTVISNTPTDDNTTSVIQLGQDYTRRDPQGGWSLRSQFNIGTGLFDATDQANAPDGQFISWLGQVQRLQRIDRRQLLVGQFDLQLTPDGLLPSEQFVIGGRRSVRGYRQNVRIGDNGLRLSLENQIALWRDASGRPTLQLAPFVDLGTVWNSQARSDQPDQRFLLGAGVGLLWQPFPAFNLRLDYGLALVDLSDRGNNLQDDGLYFTLNYRF